MTIQNKLDYLAQTKSLIKDAIIAKGGVIDDSTPFRQYADVITNLPSGGGGGIGIPRALDSNGKLIQPTDLSSFHLNCTDVGDSALAYCMGGNRYLTSVDFRNVTQLTGNNAFLQAFNRCQNLESVDFSNLEVITGSYVFSYAFDGCSSLVDVDFSKLTSISSTSGRAFEYTFNNCVNLESISFNSLESINGNRTFDNAFANCIKLKNVDFSNLKTIQGEYCFYNAFNYDRELKSCSFDNLEVIKSSNCMSRLFYGNGNLESVSFPKLRVIGSNTINGTDYGQLESFLNSSTKVTELSFPSLEYIYCSGYGSNSYGTFYNNRYVQKMYFPKLKNITYSAGISSPTTSYTDACKYVFANCGALTEIHFAAENQAAIEATAGYSTLWARGAGKATVYFDL